MKIKITNLFALVLSLASVVASAQNVTTASINGRVVNESGQQVNDAKVLVTHQPTGSRYTAVTDNSGRYALDGLRIGGPYVVAVTSGVGNEELGGVYLSLGQTLRLNVTVGVKTTTLNDVDVVATKNEIMNSQRTGAATNVKVEALNTLPTFSRSLNDFTRLTPQSRPSSVASTAGSGVSFAGADSRFNNLTVDGSIFNNSFGLASGPGGQTNAAPISLDAIEEVQVNIAPYDVRQGGFTGAGVNAITRSGGNDVSASVFYNTRNQNFRGDTVTYLDKDGNRTGSPLVINDFAVNQFGFRVGGPIKKDKIFFFVNAESERRVDPATLFTANNGDGVTDLNETRVLRSDLEDVRNLLINKFNYNPGEFENYSNQTSSDKVLAKFDFNINDKNKAWIRMNYLQSSRDVLSSNSGVVSGNRNGTVDALNFQGTNYVINNDIYSAIGELNTRISNKMSNQFQMGFTANRDYRSSRATGGRYDNGVFPLVDIMQDGRTYMSFGYEPFTPNNVLNTNTFQLQNNLTYYNGNHTITAGLNFEAFKFENTFTPTYYGQYVFNSLQDFKDMVNQAPGYDTIELRRYALTYSALEGGALPTATTRVMMPGAYLQDVISALDDKLKITVGARIDVPVFGQTALENSLVNDMKFMNPAGDSVAFNTSELPKTNPLFSPRVGFNYDVKGDRSIQVRGGTGLFSGRPPFVWLSNQVGNNGVLTGSIRQDNTTGYTFTDDVTAYIPSNPTLPSSYALALTERGFRFPQTWRSNLAVDFKLPKEFVFSLEGLYSKTVNNIYYYNANQTAKTGTRTDDGRDVFANSNAGMRINGTITDAIVLANTNQGFSYSLTGKLEKQFSNGWYFMSAYNFGETKDIMTGGSIAYSSWRDQLTVNGNNHAGLSYSDFDQRHRVIAAGSYRKNWGKNAATTVSLFYQGYNQGRTSFSVIGDLNGDLLAANDLLYVPTAVQLDAMDFADITSGGNVVYSAADQKAAFETYITSNEYLNSIRGQFTERNALVLPWLNLFDLNLVQDFSVKVGGKKQNLQLRADFYNIGNMINSSWGVSDRIVMNRPLTYTKVDGEYKYQFTRTAGELRTEIYDPSVTLGDVWQMQLGIRYSFN
ncbi:MAG: carboxypeptidase regulatory-like domain-containing protein [Schleiferiaceae bacterium]